MKKRNRPIIIITICLGIAMAAGSCERHSNRTSLPPMDIHTPDSVAGNDSIPATITMNSNFTRIVIVRLKYQTDIVQGLKDAVEKEAIKNAVILSGIGSTYRYHVHSVDNATFPSKNVFYEKEKPNDLLSVNGYIIDGRVHAHISLSDGANALGGHLEPGTLVFTFCIITIGVLDDNTSLHRFDDKTWR